MSATKLVFTYSLRLIQREWKRFVLPFFSLFIISVVLVLTLLLAGSSSEFLIKQARELNGGDVNLESSIPIDGQKFFSEAGLDPLRATRQLSFSGTLMSAKRTAPFTIRVIDNNFPLYGEILLKNGTYSPLDSGSILLDEAGLKRLEVGLGESVSFGESSLKVSDIVLAEPTSLFSSFRFLPSAFMSEESFLKSGINPQLLRAEYSYAGEFTSLNSDNIESLRKLGEKYPAIDVDIAGIDERGLQFGLETVSNFLVIAVLVTSILSAVNVYASIMYLVQVEKKSLAVLLALGLTKTKLIYILGISLCLIAIIATSLGIVVGISIFEWTRIYISESYYLNLPAPNLLIFILITMGLVLTISFMSFVPAIQRSLSLNPKQVLTGDGAGISDKSSTKSFIFITLFTLLPLIALSSFLLDSFVRGIFVILAIVFIYIFVAGVYSLLITYLYKTRSNLSMFLKTIISQKFADGIFGVVSFSSLFVALSSLSTLVLLQVSLKSFLVNDLSQTVPSTYVIDVQPSQKESLAKNFSELELFLNIGARIVSIDGVMIQKELESQNKSIDGELAREFNLTARRNLLKSEEVVQGVWTEGAKGDISVDENFAKQANIKLGSKITFLIQGFEVSGTVTSFRKTDSRSGLPFFYFVLSPDDIGIFPGVYFGYAYYEAEKQLQLGKFLAEEMPNVSMIETQSIGPLLLQVVNTLLLLVLIVTIPPLLIATLLIAVLVISSYATRRREGARFRAIGLSKKQSFINYLSETIFVTFVASIFAYGSSVLITQFINNKFLNLSSSILFSIELVTGLGIIVFFVFVIAIYLYKSDNMPLRELLSYE